MTSLKSAVLVIAAVSLAGAQRGSFAGFRPIGYPELEKPDANLGNRFGDGDNSTSTTTQRLPIEANGDKNLVDRLSKLPVDKQPFWFINWKAIEESNKNPQTYPQRPSSFAQPFEIPQANQDRPVQTEVSKNVSSNSGSGAAGTDTPNKSTKPDSVTRDVDVSAISNNRNGASDEGNLPVDRNTNTNLESIANPTLNSEQNNNNNTDKLEHETQKNKKVDVPIQGSTGLPSSEQALKPESNDHGNIPNKSSPVNYDPNYYANPIAKPIPIQTSSKPQVLDRAFYPFTDVQYNSQSNRGHPGSIASVQPAPRYYVGLENPHYSNPVKYPPQKRPIASNSPLVKKYSDKNFNDQLSEDFDDDFTGFI